MWREYAAWPKGYPGLDGTTLDVRQGGSITA
jgi:hypothetical protein